MAGNEPGVSVKPASCRSAHNELDRFTFVEFFSGSAQRRSGRKGKQHSCYIKLTCFDHNVFPLALIAIYDSSYGFPRSLPASSLLIARTRLKSNTSSEATGRVVPEAWRCCSIIVRMRSSVRVPSEVNEPRV